MMDLSKDSIVSACTGLLGRSTQEYLAFGGAAGACSMVALSVLSLLDMELSTLMLGVTQSAVLLLGGFACLEGEQSLKNQLLHWRQQAVQDYFGFAMTPLGRGTAYLLAAVHCTGVRILSPARTMAFGALWYCCCLCTLAACAVAVWTWRHPPQEARLLDADGSPDATDGPQWGYERVATYESYQPPC
mmetsp:Transcript_2616/g.3247  ORF Transcript_2616/g.3247 Transcript_2616/m.3247 type:complete len:188 (-) Transcript_2616:121-684(-)